MSPTCMRRAVAAAVCAMAAGTAGAQQAPATTTPPADQPVAQQADPAAGQAAPATAGQPAPETSGQSAPAQATGAGSATDTATVQGGPIATVEVTGIRRSIRSAEQIKRDATQVVDSINAEDIGKFPDRAAGDALQRIAGVQVGRDRGETSTVTIRGLPDVVTTLDGNDIFTGRGRRLSYQDLPVQSIAGLDVYKSATPNQPEGGIAGAVNIRLRAPFDAPGQVTTGYLEARRQEINGSDAARSRYSPGLGVLHSNRWKTGVGEMGVLLDLAYNKEHWGYPVQWVDRPDRIFSVSPDGTAVRLNDDQPVAPLNPGDRLGNLPHVGGIYNAGDRERFSAHGAFQWKINPKLEFTTQYLGMGYRARNEVDYILAIVGWAPRLNGVVLGDRGCDTPEGQICPILSANAPAAQFGPGAYEWDPYVATSAWGVKERTNTHNLNMSLRFRDGPWDVTSSLAYTHSKFINDTVIVDQQIPNATVNVYTYGADGHGGYNAVTTPTSATPLRDPNAFVLRGMVQNWEESLGKQTQWRTDATYKLGGGFIRAINAGLRLSSRSTGYHSGEVASDLRSAVRPSPVELFGPTFQSLVPGVDRLGGQYYVPSRDFLIDEADRVRVAYGMPAGRVPDDPSRMFEQRERTSTVYLSGRYQATLGGVEISGDAGVRAIHVKRKLEGTSRIGDVITPVDLSASENNYLPSISALVGWRDNLQSHLSAGKTLTRPDFLRLNPALSLIPPTVNAPGTGSAGNPQLAPTKSTNLDATLEYYFPNNGYAQIALFHRDIDGYLQNYTQDEIIDGQRYRVTRPQNSGKGTLKGYEFGTQKFFDFLPGFWSGFGAQYNFTWIDGDNETRLDPNSDVLTKTRLIDVAKKSHNLALLYEGHGLTGRLAATRRGDYVEQIAEPRFLQDRFVKASTYVDLSLSYEITPNISVQFDAINLTKEKYESYVGDPSRPRDIRYTPTTYGVGLRFKL
ncbi:TonB-dependent receptor [Pseudoduganella umbonata]|uniref:TonB-dependent receptor n=1 Tax=Pseudoduganella umbonata TaxID=864828 RepID=A0A4P8HP01_9BURK|nr:TonB-dependent receptor [Pseudoduganella umbonata]MBB3220201.1 TonB-dependent receptor [Pseudoduganella umbonata]QCP10184.1 TonB-dependent receptor [Pseudoduganella umbonata]